VRYFLLVDDTVNTVDGVTGRLTLTARQSCERRLDVDATTVSFPLLVRSVQEARDALSGRGDGGDSGSSRGNAYAPEMSPSESNGNPCISTLGAAHWLQGVSADAVTVLEHIPAAGPVPLWPVTYHYVFDGCVV